MRDDRANGLAAGAPVSAIALQQALRAPSASHPTQLLALQRHIGNRAVGHAVQRGGVGELVKDKGADLGIGVLDNIGGLKGAIAGGEGFAHDPAKGMKFFNADANPAAWALGVGGGAVGAAGVGNLVGMGFDAAQIDKVRKRLKDRNLDPLERKSLERILRVKGGDIGQRVGAVGGHVADAAALGLGTGAAAAGAAGVAAPLQIFNVARIGRKARRQRGRQARVKGLMEDWTDPQQKAQQLLQAKAAVRAAEREHDQLQKQLQDQKRWAKAGAGAAGIKDAQDELDDAAAALSAAKAEVAKLEQQIQSMKAAVADKGSSNTEPSLEEIAAYAKLKQNRGLRKKLVEMVGGSVGATGSIVLAVAAAAGGAALMATPVGWTLAAIAAGAAIGMGIYKLSRWWHKKRTRKGEPGKRQAYAKHLFDTAVASDEKGKQARRLILNLVNAKALGLPGVDEADKAQQELHTKLVAASNDPRARKKFTAMIADKMAS